MYLVHVTEAAKTHLRGRSYKQFCCLLGKVVDRAKSKGSCYGLEENARVRDQGKVLRPASNSMEYTFERLD